MAAGIGVGAVVEAATASLSLIDEVEIGISEVSNEDAVIVSAGDDGDGETDEGGETTDGMVIGVGNGMGTCPNIICAASI